jgi:hypothetical protein
MERRLIGYAATDDGDALALVAEAQAVKPGSPSAIQVSLDANLVATPRRSPSVRFVSLICPSPVLRSAAGVVLSIERTWERASHVWG